MVNPSHSVLVCPSESAGALHVVDLARRADVTPATVRYYARIGLLNPGRNIRNGYRRFRNEDLRRLQFIRKAQALGLTISDIRLILERMDDQQPVCEQVIQLLRNRLDGVRQAQRELEATGARIEKVLDGCRQGENPRPGYCPLIEEAEI